jgi:hypothetical protein
MIGNTPDDTEDSNLKQIKCLFKELQRLPTREFLNLA